MLYSAIRQLKNPGTPNELQLKLKRLTKVKVMVTDHYWTQCFDKDLGHSVDTLNPCSSKDLEPHVPRQKRRHSNQIRHNVLRSADRLLSGVGLKLTLHLSIHYFLCHNGTISISLTLLCSGQQLISMLPCHSCISFTINNQRGKSLQSFENRLL